MSAVISSNAASITEAPVSIVDMNLSWPGQSQKDTCRTNTKIEEQPILGQAIESGELLGKDL